MAQERVLTEEFPYLTILTFPAPAANQWVHFWTTTLLPGTADTVMHLVRGPDSSYAQYDLAYNDNYGGGLGSEIWYRIPSGLTQVTLIVRSKSASTSGYALLNATTNGSAYSNTPAWVYVGGNIVASSEIAWGELNSVLTALRPGGTDWTAAALFDHNGDGADPYTKIQCPIWRSGGAKGGVLGYVLMFLQFPDWPTNGPHGILLGTPCSQLTSTGLLCSGHLHNGLADLYINDFLDDSDGDGLGAELEAALGTCDSAAPTDCPYTNVFDSADTDGDALTDSEEVFGLLPSADPEGVGLNFPLWGANPLHKDMFVEVDYYNATSTNPYVGAASQTFAEALAGVFAEGTAGALRNPDGEDGLAIHLDMGVDWTGSGVPPGTLVGNYDSGSARFSAGMGSWAVLGLCPYRVRFSGPNCTTASVLCTALAGIDQEATALLNAVSACPAMPVSARVVGKTTIELEEDLQTGLGWLTGFAVECQAVPGGPWGVCPNGLFEVSDYSNNLLRAHYTNPDYVDQVRVNRFFYAVGINGGTGQASTTDNYGRTLVWNAQNTTGSADTIAHEMGHMLGLTHTGNASALGWANCAANYPSIMSYSGAYGIADTGFYEQDVGYPLNPSSISEGNILPSYMTARMQGSGWKYFVDALLRVDWNRSGVVANGGPYQLPINMGAGPQSCNAFGGGVQAIVPADMFLAAGTGATGQPDLCHIYSAGSFDRMAIFYTSGTGQVLYRTAAIGGVSNASCTGSDDGSASNCLAFVPATPNQLPGAANATGISVLWWENRLFVAYVTRDSLQVVLNRYSYNDATMTFSLLPTESTTFDGDYCGQPELQFMWGQTAVPLVMAAVCRNEPLGGPAYVWNFWVAANLVWLPDWLPVRDAANLQYAGPGSPGSVAWPDPLNTSMPQASRRTCLMLPEGNTMRFACWHQTELVFEDLTAASFPVRPGNWCRPGWVTVSGRCLPPTMDGTKPELTFVPMRFASGAVASPSTGFGRLMLTYPRPDPTIPVPDVWLSDYIYTGSPGSPIGTSPLWGGTQARWMVDDFINKWAFLQLGTNLALYADSTLGGAMAVGAFRTERGKLNYYPHADGTPNQTYTPESDFVTMRYGVCLGVTNRNYQVCEGDN